MYWKNKNWTALRFLYYLAHKIEQLKNMIMSFPVRGYSYMECDRGITYLNQKFPTETPADWRNVLQTSCTKPELYNVINLTGDMFMKLQNF